MLTSVADIWRLCHCLNNFAACHCLLHFFCRLLLPSLLLTHVSTTVLLHLCSPLLPLYLDILYLFQTSNGGHLKIEPCNKIRNCYLNVVIKSKKCGMSMLSVQWSWYISWNLRAIPRDFFNCSVPGIGMEDVERLAYLISCSRKYMNIITTPIRMCVVSCSYCSIVPPFEWETVSYFQSSFACISFCGAPS